MHCLQNSPSTSRGNTSPHTTWRAFYHRTMNVAAACSYEKTSGRESLPKTVLANTISWIRGTEIAAQRWAVPEAAGTGSTLVVRIPRTKRSLYFCNARVSRRLRLPVNSKHLVPGFTDSIRVLKWMLVFDDARNGAVSRGGSWEYEGHGGLFNTPSLVGKSSGLYPSCPDRVFSGGGSGGRVYNNSQLKRPSQSPVRKPLTPPCRLIRPLADSRMPGIEWRNSIALSKLS